jgi:O-antigen ligase
VYAFALSHGDIKYQAASLMVLMLFVLVSVLLQLSTVRVSRAGILGSIVLGTVLCTNVLINIDNLGAIGDGAVIVRMAGVVAFTFCAHWAVYVLRPVSIFTGTALMLAPLVLYINYVGFSAEYSLRVNPMGLHPNWWGEVALAMALCALAIRSYLIKSIVVADALIAMYFVQSRGALAALIVAYAVYFLCSLRGVHANRILTQVGYIFIALSVAVVLVVLSGKMQFLTEFLVQRVLFINNPYRGIESGVTGRLDGWMYAIDVFLENPFFGKGFDTLSVVHNGFLRWAGEGGLVLLSVMALFIILAMFRAWRMNNYLVIASLIGVLTYMMTYPRALNLNIVGAIFLLLIFPWARSVKNEDR